MLHFAQVGHRLSCENNQVRRMDINSYFVFVYVEYSIFRFDKVLVASLYSARCIILLLKLFFFAFNSILFLWTTYGYDIPALLLLTLFVLQLLLHVLLLWYFWWRSNDSC
jgi:hypothetical protein